MSRRDARSVVVQRLGVNERTKVQRRIVRVTCVCVYQLFLFSRRRGANTAHTQMGRPTHEAPTREYTREHKQTHSAARQSTVYHIYPSRAIDLCLAISADQSINLSSIYIIWLRILLSISMYQAGLAGRNDSA